MKKFLLGAAALTLSVFMANAQYTPTKDADAPYSSSDGNVTMESVWIRSLKTIVSDDGVTNNFPADILTNANARCYAFKDGKLIFVHRVVVGENTVPRLEVFDAATGDYLETKSLDGLAFTTPSGSVNNSIAIDGAGNIVLFNLVTDIYSGALDMWVMADLNATPVNKIRFSYGAQESLFPETKDGTVRIDNFNVYGDMNGNGYVMGAVAASGTNPHKDYLTSVFRWDIKDGALVGTTDPDSDFSPELNFGIPGQPTIIKLEELFPISSLNLGGAPYVRPISENLFYVDGQASYPSLYDMEGKLQDGFSKAPAGVAFFSASGCGVDEVVIGGVTYFLSALYLNSQGKDGYPDNSFGLFSYEGGFSTAKFLFDFPKQGFGSASTTAYSTLPIIDKKSISYTATEATVDVYIFICNNGFAKYQMKIKGNFSGIDDVAVDAVTARYVDGNIEMTEEVGSVEVYTLTGQKVNEAQNTKIVSAPFTNGLYIVKMTTKAGETFSEKVLVK
ncbi:T9SS type A sorting domain-containing protein [Dysgonomonas sp. 520]|uniref:T9SS type A sorting domain-containing protein n=1 Tax=Dysgonomonas sp. 520 TaxID=2302931 RepID=UPI0013D14A33|nr:T9SS type A sorting domain-containing protein [Dysgonomonas sp. 520]NDW10354.1 T9SS C-terminal target domain-containing protein [Dysgonomonas sp. 520]